MTREPSFNAPTSEHTLLHLELAIEQALHLRNSQAAKSLAIAFDMHTRQLIKESKR
jgi:hypothetical protein